MPEVAFEGTAQEAETAQLPQSMSPVAELVRQGGWVCGNAAEALMVATFRAPFPW